MRGVCRRRMGSSPITRTKTKSADFYQRILFCTIHFSLFNIHYSLKQISVASSNSFKIQAFVQFPKWFYKKLIPNYEPTKSWFFFYLYSALFTNSVGLCYN